ncbi:GntR family transcriptional regulator [Nocardia beijingensis]|uniref:GntR family transcriptional regulator n=1 Tax=Nocardia TaxID=1817 RepID=UPI00135B2886|nr:MULTISPECIES: GntR family transcriptional regulator [Nocardia]MBF6465899.1 GntR family transcriptional regulator [Nocardia beijingensis]
MMRRPRTAADFAVLGVLAPGGLLTVEQLAQQARLTSWTVRSALLRLQSRGLIMDCQHRGRWAITPRGRGEWAAKGRRFTL